MPYLDATQNGDVHIVYNNIGNISSGFSDFQADVHIFQHIQPTSEIQKHVRQGTHLQLHQVQNSPRPHSRSQ
jgi:hypothetical protein